MNISWLTIAEATTLLATLMLLAIFAWVYRRKPEDFSFLWVLGWGVYALRLAFGVWNSLLPIPSVWLQIAYYEATGLSALILLRAAWKEADAERFRLHAALAFLAVSAWVIYGAYAALDSFWVSLPTFFFFGAVQILTGWLFLRENRTRRYIGGYAAGWGFLLWGLHKFDYPFLRPIAWFAPIGYTVGSLLTVLVGLGIVALLFEHSEDREKRLAAELQKERDALRESQLKYRAVIEQSAEGVTIADLDGRYVMVNPAFCRMTGYSEEELLQMKVTDLLPKHVVPTLFPQVAQRRLPGEREVELLRKDGTTFFALIIGSPLEINGKQYVQGIAQDITERVRSQETLMRFSRIFEELENEVYIFDAESFKFLEANCAAQQHTGYDMDELARMTPLDLKPEMTAERFHALLARLRGGEKQVVFETVYRRKNASLYPVEVRLQMFRYESRTAFLAVVSDVSERKRAEEQIRQLNATLERRVEERARELRQTQEELLRQQQLAILGRVAGGVGHELRNPLGVITNAVYFLKMAQADAAPKIREYLDLIERHAYISENIVADLLNFTGERFAERGAVSIVKAVQQTLERFPVPEGIQIFLDLPADLPPIFADFKHVVQILGNLILNAYQAMPRGGTLSIAARATDSHTLTVTVEDSGAGVAPEYVNKLFEPLFTTKVKGIGLGLAVGRKLAETNGGRLEFQSQPGKGGAFALSLPIYQESV